MIKKIEKIADTLEEKGLILEAEMLDSICNSMEKYALKMPWSKKPSPEPEDDADIPSGPANRTHYVTHTDGIDHRRFYTDKEPPATVKSLFARHSDGKWYLQDVDNVEIEEVSPGSFKIFKLVKDQGTDIPGLTAY